jgi:hypothetical protein
MLDEELALIPEDRVTQELRRIAGEQNKQDKRGRHECRIIGGLYE